MKENIPIEELVNKAMRRSDFDYNDIPEIMNKGNLKGEILVEGLGGSPRINTGVVGKDSIVVKDQADYGYYS